MTGEVMQFLIRRRDDHGWPAIPKARVKGA
jgi:hypothetical protein